MKLSLLLICSVLFWSNIFCQNATPSVSERDTVICGTITDGGNGDPLIGASIVIKGTTYGTITDVNGQYCLKIPKQGHYTLVCSYTGFTTTETAIVTKGVKKERLDFKLNGSTLLQEVVVTGYGTIKRRESTGAVSIINSRVAGLSISRRNKNQVDKKTIDKPFAFTKANKKQKRDFKHQRDSIEKLGGFNTEEYGYWLENNYKSPKDDALSTFSIDVDRASYANVRRFISNGTKPPSGAVRIEEMINYFDYNYPAPPSQSEHPLSIISEMGTCPWNKDHLLLHIGLQGKRLDLEKAPQNNLVFLIDVSGSMESSNKLPLVKEALRILINNLREQDHVALVVYAGSAGLVLPPTSGTRKETILNALNALQAGGSTAGGAGIQLAYKTAQENFVPDGNNRVILATDGDFNVGVSSESELVKLIEDKRKTGVFLSVLGFGMGNYKDSKMEQLADKGNGNYAYIDNIDEAKKVFGKEMGGTLYTIAKDVKFQLEFNPSVVESYRLIGYENRLLDKEDFNDDTKDAGEVGAGHTVTALYEIIPKGTEMTQTESPSVDKLRYQKTIPTIKSGRNEVVFLKLRYKKPTEDTSILIEQAVPNVSLSLSQTSDNFRFAAAVAGFAQILRQSKFIGDFDMNKAKTLATGSLGKDTEGYRAGFIQLIELAQRMDTTAKN
ncbi:MAG: von Willebrand factor type A domain-containing protein [Saprospiraceae bacterium]|nr:von Willebrand factor type A domain-containing protein [Saprospiraceae bacterium]